MDQNYNKCFSIIQGFQTTIHVLIRAPLTLMHQIKSYQNVFMNPPPHSIFPSHQQRCPRDNPLYNRTSGALLSRWLGAIRILVRQSRNKWKTDVITDAKL